MCNMWYGFDLMLTNAIMIQIKTLFKDHEYVFTV